MRAIQFVGSFPSFQFSSESRSDAADCTEPLRYQVSDGMTNIYHVEIEMRGENGTEILAGNLMASTRLVSSNVFALGLRGTLTPERDGGLSSRPITRLP